LGTVTDFLPSLDHAFWIVALGSMATIPAGTCLPTTVDPTPIRWAIAPIIAGLLAPRCRDGAITAYEACCFFRVTVICYAIGGVFSRGLPPVLVDPYLR
jgi:hypothetical protein